MSANHLRCRSCQSVLVTIHHSGRERVADRVGVVLVHGRRGDYLELTCLCGAKREYGVERVGEREQ